MNVSDFTTPGTNGRPTLAGASCLPPMRKATLKATEQPPTPQTEQAKKQAKRKTADRFGVLNAFVDCSLAELSRSEIVVWLVLYRDTKGGTVQTSQTNIARRSGMSVRSVGKATAKLIDAGLLQLIFQGGLNRGPSRYRVNPLRNRSS